MSSNFLRVSAPLAGVQPIEDLLGAIVGTAFAEDSIPISCMIVAPSGAGKSRTIIRFDAPYIMRCDDLTSSGLMDILTRDSKSEIKFLLIPDFNPILSHKASVSNLLLANLLSVTQDGTARIVDGRGNKEVKHKPVGIITAVTFDMFARYSRKWHELGITRRILPIHYTYSLRTIQQAQTLIREGKINGNNQPMSMSEYRQLKVVIEQNLANDIQILSERLAMNLGQFIKLNRGVRTPQYGEALLPMAPHVVLNSIARGNAVRFGRRRLEQADVDLATEFVSFTDMVNRRQL
jgi:hypothetical protein